VKLPDISGLSDAFVRAVSVGRTSTKENWSDRKNPCRYVTSLLGLKYHPIITRVGLTPASEYDSEAVDAIFWAMGECARIVIYQCEEEKAKDDLIKELKKIEWAKMSSKKRQAILKCLPQKNIEYLEKLFCES